VNEFEEGFLDINDVRLEYNRLGNNPADSPTLVFLHEGLGSVALWKDFPEKLVEVTGLNAFVYSRQSYGKSSPLASARKADYMHRESLEILPGVLRAAGINNPLLIGHSDGASIALIYAGSDQQPRPIALILMAAHVFNEQLSVDSIALARQAYQDGDLRKRLAAYHDDVDNAFWRWNDIWLDDEFRDWNIESCLGNIAIPVLHIQGEDDEYGTQAQALAIQKQSTGPVEILMLSDCRHAPFRDQTQATLKRISEFIDQYSQRAYNHA